MLEFLFNKVAGLRACNFIEKDSNADVSCEIFENFKSKNFEELQTTVPVRLRKMNDTIKQQILFIENKNMCELHEVSLCNIHVIPNCLLLFIRGLRRGQKLIMITILALLVLCI